MDRPEKDIPNGESHISKEVSKVQEWLRNKRDSFDHNNILERHNNMSIDNRPWCLIDCKPPLPAT